MAASEGVTPEISTDVEAKALESRVVVIEGGCFEKGDLVRVGGIVQEDGQPPKTGGRTPASGFGQKWISAATKPGHI